MRVIIDTNILVSGLMSKSGPPARIVDAVLDGRITPVFSSVTLAELKEVLHRPRLRPFFERGAVDIEIFLEKIGAISEIVAPRPGASPLESIRDPKDVPFVQLANTPPFPDLLITGDRDFEQGLYGQVPVVSARRFVFEFLAI